MQDNILNLPTLCAANSNMLREIIRFYEIPVYTSAKVLEITDKEVQTQYAKYVQSTLTPATHPSMYIHDIRRDETEEYKRLVKAAQSK